MRNVKAYCRNCGRVTIEGIDDFFPECSHTCAEWVVDAEQEEQHFGRDSWGNEDDGKFW